jgi:hypothetical protein
VTFVKASYGNLARRSAATLIEPMAHHLLMAIRLAYLRHPIGKLYSWRKLAQNGEDSPGRQLVVS